MAVAPKVNFERFLPNSKLTFDSTSHCLSLQLIKFHPLAKDVLLTAAFDRTARIWNLGDFASSDSDDAAPRIELEGHGDQLYGAQFSQCGRFLATVCKDGRIRVYDPRQGVQPVIEGAEIVPKKGARIVWAMDGKFLIVTGFSRCGDDEMKYTARLQRSKTYLPSDPG